MPLHQSRVTPKLWSYPKSNHNSLTGIKQKRALQWMKLPIWYNIVKVLLVIMPSISELKQYVKSSCLAGEISYHGIYGIKFVYKQLILPIFDYVDYVYDCICQRDAKILQRLQNLSLKSILRVDKWKSTAEVHYTSVMEMLDVRREGHGCNEMNKVHYQKCLHRYVKYSL